MHTLSIIPELNVTLILQIWAGSYLVHCELGCLSIHPQRLRRSSYFLDCTENIEVLVIQDYNSLPTMPTIPTPTLTHSQHCLANKKSGTGGSFARVRCSCNSKLTILIKLAIRKPQKWKEMSLSRWQDEGALNGRGMWGSNHIVSAREEKRSQGKEPYTSYADPGWE